MAVLFSIEPPKNSLTRAGSVLVKADLLWLLPFVVLVAFPVFWQLTSLPILLWDEGRMAVNAAEMADNGNLIVTYFQGKPDMWNSKPPLQIWLMALSIKVLGYSEFAIRFPTTIAVLCTFGLLFWFCLRVFRSKLVAALSVMVLVTSRGYMAYHVARTGDYDALLIFFITLYTFSFFLYLEENKPKFWWLCVAGLTLAVLTKGVAGLLCAPALLVYVLYRDKLLTLLKKQSFYGGIAVFLVFTLGYYLLREELNPGYLQAVYDNELGGRYLATLDRHLHPWNWYLSNMLQEKYVYWFPVLFLAIWVLCWSPAPPVKRFLVLAVSFLVIFMLVISTAQTKLFWYEAPVYPVAAVLIALGSGILLQAASQYLNVRQTAFFFITAVLLLCWKPYTQVLDQYLLEKEAAPGWFWDAMFGPALKVMADKYPDEKQLIFFEHKGQNPAIMHYYKIAYGKKGYRFKQENPETAARLKPGQIVMVCNPELNGYLEERFAVEKLHSYHSTQVFRILEMKSAIHN